MCILYNMHIIYKQGFKITMGILWDGAFHFGLTQTAMCSSTLGASLHHPMIQCTWGLSRHFGVF